MLNKLRDKNAILFGIIVIIIFRIAQFIGGLPLDLIFKTGAVPADSFSTIYFIYGFPDIFVILVMLFILWRTNRLSLLTKKGKGFFKSLPLCVYPIFMSFLYLMVGFLAVAASSARSVTAMTIVSLILCMLIIAFAEEFACRAIVAETLLEHFGSERAGVIKACIISGILFGLLHALNPGSTASVAVNCITAAVGGVTYAIIYFRTGNLPALIFIHALNDIAIFTSLLLANTSGVAASSSSGMNGNVMSLFLMIPEILVILFLTRKKKIGEVKEQWQEELSK